MSSEQVKVIEYFDNDSKSEACLMVRRVDQHIGLCISLKDNGDIETFLGKEEVKKLIGALQQAIIDQEK